MQVIATVVTLFSDQSPINNTINRVSLHLNNFIGIKRRFEMIGTIYGCHIYDDYAHHPTEVSAVIQAARQRFPNKSLLVVFQPHTYRYSSTWEQLRVSFCIFSSLISMIHIIMWDCLMIILQSFSSTDGWLCECPPWCRSSCSYRGKMSWHKVFA